MAGTKRSGRRRRVQGKIIKTAVGRPKRPRTKLTRDEAWAWDNLVKPAKHLGEIDTALCVTLVEMWGLKCQAMDMAKRDPADRDIRLAAQTYTKQFDTLCQRLGIDPLGRERAYGTLDEQGIIEDERGKKKGDDPLQEFGIVG